MKKTVVIIILFLFHIGFSQDMPKVVPPSPEAASLFKFNEIPVSLYSGLHNTSIPLLEINSGGISIPISISYHSRGVQVSEIASKVGTGWALNCGGMISRQIRGAADDLSPNGYLCLPNSTSGFYTSPTKRENASNGSFWMNETYDDYPDKFMINSNFFSGEFYFDKQSGEVLTQKFSDIRIKTIRNINSGLIDGFEVEDNLGNTYYFGGEGYDYGFANENELITNNFTFSQNGFLSSSGQNSTFPYSSWLLRKIITSTNEVITFTYENKSVVYYRRSGDKDDYTNPLNNPAVASFSSIFSYQKNLKEIKFKEGKVVFTNSPADRLDLQGGSSLDLIELYNLKNKLIKKIKFNYSYTTVPVSVAADNNISCGLLINDSFAKKRMFLNSIQFKDNSNSSGSNITEKTYQFEYDSQILPSRHSNSIDNWGYYNGKNRGRFISYSATNFDHTAVDAVKMQAGLLKKIIYPTGGFTTFEYEPNVLINHLPFTFNEIQDINGPKGFEILNPNPVIYIDTNYLSYLSPLRYIGGKYTLPVTIPAQIMGNFTTDFTAAKNGEDIFPYQCTLSSVNPGGPTYTIQQGLHQNLTFQPGNYNLIYDPADPWLPMPPNLDLEYTINHSFSLSVTWHQTAYDVNQIVYGPGSRVKKITNFSANNMEETSKLYTYSNSQNIPNGMLLSVANYRVVNSYIGSGKVYDSNFFANSGLFQSFSKDNFGYFSVDEYLLDRNSAIKDKVTYRYSILPDYGSYYKFPAHPISDNDWFRGTEIGKTIYKNKNGVFSKVKKIENNFLLYNSISINAATDINPINTVDVINSYDIMPLGVEIEKLLDVNIIPNPYIKNRFQFCYPTSTFFNFNYYVNDTNDIIRGYRTSFLIGGTFDLKSTKVTDFVDDVVQMENITTYDYDYDHHYNVAKSTSSSSTGETIETSYQYAGNDTILHYKLFKKNMVGIPLITQSKRNGNILSTQEVEYVNVGTAELPVLSPKKIKSSKGGLPLETKITYNQISSTGNPEEVQQENGMRISYIWGYNDTLPVAKLENIAYAEIPSNLINTIKQNTSSSTAEQAVLTALDTLRSSTNVALQKAMITTYTYIPLVGVSTITDPKGDRIKYFYDVFNRLEYIKDKDNNILKDNKYQYVTGSSGLPLP